MCKEESDHPRGGGGGDASHRGVISVCDQEDEYRRSVTNYSNDRFSRIEDVDYNRRRTSSSRFRYFRLRSSLVLLIALVTALCLLPHQSLCLDSTEGENASVLISQSEVKTIEPTNNPTKVFVRRRIFRKLVKDPSSASNSASIEEPTSSTTSPPPSTNKSLFSLAKRLQNNPNKKDQQRSSSSTVTGNSLKNSMQSSQSLIAAKQKFNFQSLKTRLGLAAPTSSTASNANQEAPTTASPNQNNSSNLVMIPLPPSQRKAYTPVIMQVSKSTTSKPETKVQTFKLNKMFVPIGIYGKVVENETETASSTQATAEQPNSSSTPIPSIKHRGTETVTESGPKRERKVKGIADSVDLTYGKPDMKTVSFTTERPDIGSISITTEANELFSSVFGSGSSGLSGNGVRRGDQYKNGGYGGNNKPFSSNSGLTLMTPPALGNSDAPSSLVDSLASYGTYSSYSNNYNSNKNKYSPSSIVGSITDSMSRIPSLVPSLFHKGLTSLASMTSSMKENPFEDENFSGESGNHNKQKPLISAPSSYTPKIPASVPGGYISGLRGSGGNGGYGGPSRDQSYAGSELSGSSSSSGGGGSKKPSGGMSSQDMVEYETLEYFRKRPHLLAQLQQQQQQKHGSSWRRSQGVRFSKGFKPANAPEAIAREYYKSTSTTAPTPEEELLLKAYQNIRRAKKMGRGSWLLRNSNEYVSNKNEKLVRMWRNLFDSFSNDGPPPPTPQQQKAQDRMDKADNNKEDPSSTLQARRSSPQSPSQKPRNPILSAHWSSIKSKYSKDQIDEAKERILTLLNSGYGDEALLDDSPGAEHDEEELQHVVDYDTHMPPPPPPPHHHHHHHGPPPKTLSLTKGLSGAAAGAFKDLVKFFKLGVSVGTGQSKEPVNYEQVVDEQEEQELGAVGGDWKPVIRRPLISFSAGISLKNPLSSSSSSSKPHHHHHHGPPPPSHHHHHHDHHDHHVPSTYVEEVDLPPGSSSSTHYSSSSSPYIPQSYKGLNHYIDEIASTSHSGHPPSPTSPSYSTASYEQHGDGPGDVSHLQSPDYPSDDIISEDGPDDGEYGATSTSHAYAINPAKLRAHQQQQQQQTYGDSEAEYSYDAYRTLKPSKRPGSQSHLDLDDSNTDWNPVRAGASPSPVVYNPGLGSSSEYELVPSSVYLNGAHDPRDIAAVVKPAGVSDDMVRSVLPAGLRNLRILDYPNEYASLNSISQALGSGGKEEAVGSSSASRASFKNAMKKLRENYVAKESAYLPGEGIGEEDIGVVGAGAAGLGAYYGGAGLSNSAISHYYNQQNLLLQQQQQLQQLAQQQQQLQQQGYGGIAGLESIVGGSGSVFAHANRINNNNYGGRGSISQYAQLSGGGGAQEEQHSGKDSLGFNTNYNLPQNLDPDIAAILKSELDKDDIPEDVRQEFLEAKREEQKKKQAQQQQQQAAYQSNNRRVDFAQQTLIDSLLSTAKAATPPPATAAPRTQAPQQQQYVQYAQQQQPTAPSMQSRAYHPNNPYAHYHQQQPHQQPRPLSQFINPAHPQRPPPHPHQSVVSTRFFAPIPITPTLMTTALKNPRYSSPVPRYVIELAKKLQSDKSVQGIVRVSAKRGRGLPPIEYLYPVKG